METDVIHRRGRGTALNPPNRFDRLHRVEDPEALDENEIRTATTRLIPDATRSVLSANDSPDVPFKYSLNPYRGCEHGCPYCYARPSHEYLGFSAGLDFETQIVVKHDAPSLLAREFEREAWEPQVVALSGNTDPYQPSERQLGLTRKCLETFLAYRNPVAIISKNHLITRDLDILTEMASMGLVHVAISVTTLDAGLAGSMEPRASRPSRRLDAIRQLTSAGVPVAAMLAPVVPGLTDEEMPAILDAVYEAGARRAAYIVLRLPGPVAPLFEEWLRREYPLKADGVLSRVRSLRSGKLNDPRHGIRMRGEGQWAEIFSQLFTVSTNKLGLNRDSSPLRTDLFRRSQGELF